MRQTLKTLFATATLTLVASCSWGFALFGPINEPFQVPNIGYGLGGDLGAPKNLAEEYRRNVPTNYYAFDANFIEFFGSNGMYFVSQAFEMLNSVTNASKMSRTLTEYPLSTIRANDAAGALGLNDLKSLTLNLLMEQLGLADPDRFTWALHSRFVGPGGCPADMSYSIIKRNFDPVPTSLNQLPYSSYVNGALYTYFVNEICTGGDPLAEAYEVALDPLDLTFTAVATDGDPLDTASGIAVPGYYFTGLTRDDYGGLRYLYQTNNMNTESAGQGTFTYITNNTPQLLYTSNLTELAFFSLTNDPGTVAGRFPGIQFYSVSNYFVNVWVTNITSYLSNSPYAPVGDPPITVFVTNRTQTVQVRYKYLFENVVTVQRVGNYYTPVNVVDLNNYMGHQYITIQTVEVTNTPYSPVGTPPVTNTTFTTALTDAVVGEFFVLPTNLCSIAIVSLQATFTNAITNLVYSATNTPPPATGTNTTTTNSFYSIDQSIIAYYTNHAYVILPVTCPTNTIALRQGIDRLRFERRNYDSLIGRFFEPFTNNYNLMAITNSQLVRQTISRPVNGPDFLITADDLAPGPATPPGAASVARGIIFSTNTLFAYPGLAGPGTIEQGTTFTYNKVGPIYANFSGAVYFWRYAESAQQLIFLWGSYDGSTNAPIVYPNGTTIEMVENSILITITPSTLPDGARFLPYNATFSATGGQAPYTWGLSPGSAGLPPGLGLDMNSGTISGTPTQDDTFDFVIRMTDAVGRYVDRPYAITIHP